MADGHHGDIIIVRKKVSGGHGHHGGAWKIAFADFMTAMMAFFLVLWIINASDKDTKTVIARYFNPVKLENPARAKKGVHGSTAAPTEGKDDHSDKSSGPPSKKKDAKGAPPPSEAKPDKAKDTPLENVQPSEAQMQAAEAQLFSSPYEALDRIAGGMGESAPGAAPELGDSDPQRLNGALSIDAFRDPFKPIGPGSPDDPVAFDADARSKAAPDLEPGKTGQESKPAVKPLADAKLSPKPHEKLAPGDAPKLAPKPAGGDADSGEAAAEGAKPGLETAKAAEAAKVEKEIKQQVASVLKPGAGPEIEAKQTKDGLLISLTDKLDFSMFAIGSARPAPELVRAMAAVAKIIKARPGHIVVRGYTDARPYRNGAYDNWRLSSDRAQMAYYMLTRGGAQAARFVRVEGYADRAPRDAAHPLAAVNRRLEILIEEPKS
jgi:chemotaxis protein MotB